MKKLLHNLKAAGISMEIAEKTTVMSQVMIDDISDFVLNTIVEGMIKELEAGIPDGEK